MSAQTIYDATPLGAILAFSDGTPRPLARFSKKLAAWEQSNGTGRLVRKTPPYVRGTYASPACITLHEGDFASGGVVLLTVHRTHNLDSPLKFEVISLPKPGSWRIVQPFGETVELLHIAADRAGAEAWLGSNRYSGARVEPVADFCPEITAMPPGAPIQSTPDWEAVS